MIGVSEYVILLLVMTSGVKLPPRWTIMRSSRSLLVLVIAIGALISATASPGVVQAVCFEASLVSQVEADGMHLQITLTQWSWSTYCWPNELAGVDVYRRALGTTCGPLVLVTDEPIPWTGLPAEGEPFAFGEIVDSGVEGNTAYEYVARAVDAQRKAVAGNPDAVIGYASTGEALIGHGYLVATPDCGISFIQWIDTCEDACFPRPFVGSPVPADVSPYFNSETSLRIYGEFNGVSPSFCNVHWPRVFISRVEVSSCIVAVQPVTWGNVKSVYQ